ncbi:MAG: hypothetical protein WA624_16290 [Methylocella sp.]
MKGEFEQRNRFASPAARMIAAVCRTYAALSTAPLPLRSAAMISATIAMPISGGQRAATAKLAPA